jgi:hypothetical protein
LTCLPAEVANHIVTAQLVMADTPEPMTAEVSRLIGHPARTYAEWVADHREEFH